MAKLLGVSLLATSTFTALCWSVLEFANGDASVVVRARLGVDAALYVDAASYLLDGQPEAGLTSNTWEGSFGPAAIHQHLRIGIPALLATTVETVGGTAPFLVIGALLPNVMTAIVLASLGLAWIFFDAFWQRILTVAFVIVNYTLWHLLLEGQWPQLLSAALVTAAVAVLVVRTNASSNGLHRAALPQVLFLGLLIAAITFTYAEILPLLVLWGVVSLLLLLIRGRTGDLRASLMLAISAVAFAAFLLAPWLGEYIGHMLTISTGNVGYNLPHTPYPQDIVGIGNVWSLPERWMTGEVSVAKFSREHPLRDAFIGVFVVFLVTSGAWRLSYARKSVSGLSLCLTLCATALYFLGVERSDYLWAKSFSTFVPMTLALVVAGLAWGEQTRLRGSAWLAKSIGLGLLIASTVVLLSGLKSFQDSSRSLTRGIVSLSEGGLGNCEVISSPRGTQRPSGNLDATQWRYVDFVYDYWLSAIFRKQGVVDGWTTLPIQKGAGWTPKSEWCLVIDTFEFPISGPLRVDERLQSGVLVSPIEAESVSSALAKASLRIESLLVNPG